MTHRERLERKIEKRRAWAAMAEQKSTESYTRAQALVKDIPLGQPVLVGHHSERRHRAALSKSGHAMRSACELSTKAKMHETKADNLELALDRTIFSDDENAIEAIEQRIKANEAKRESMKKINALYRKQDIAGLHALGIDYESLKARLEAAGPYFGKAPHMPYEMSNLGARIQSDKKRIEAIKLQDARQDRAAAAGGVVIVRGAGGYAQITFAAKPEYVIIRALKDAGFHWSNGSWFGKTDAIPLCVAKLGDYGTGLQGN